MKHRNGYKIRISTVVILLVQLLLLVYPSLSEAILNPSAVYCNALGYTYYEGGICRLPNGQQVGAHDFVAGKVALNWSYCAINGYGAKHIENSEMCKDCCVCVLADGTEVEVMTLMELSLKETTCGDGTCGTPENFGTCPADCPSGEWDGYCDGVKDGKIDPDCAEGEDPDSVFVDLDKDGDRVPDENDKCLESNIEVTIVIGSCDSSVRNKVFNDGCTMNDLIGRCRDSAKDHGEFVSCVSHLSNSWINDALIGGKQKAAIQSCAAKSAIP